MSRATDRLLDDVCDLEKSEEMCKRSVGWEVRIASIPGGYVVRVFVDGVEVVTVDDSWLDRGIRRAHEAFEDWRARMEATRLEQQLRVSVDRAERRMT